MLASQRITPLNFYCIGFSYPFNSLAASPHGSSNELNDSFSVMFRSGGGFPLLAFATRYLPFLRTIIVSSHRLAPRAVAHIPDARPVFGRELSAPVRSHGPSVLCDALVCSFSRRRRRLYSRRRACSPLQ